MNSVGSRISPAIRSQIRQLVKAAHCEDYCYKGSEADYKKLQQNAAKQLKPTSKIYCLDKSAIDMALQLATRRRKALTLISTTSFGSFVIKPKQGQSQQNVSTITAEQFANYFDQKSHKIENLVGKISASVSEMALHLLKTQRFVVTACCLNTHPFQSYIRMCGYLMAKRDRNITKYFERTAFSNQLLWENIATNALLTQLRDKYLYTDYYKLKHLPRRNESEWIDEQTKQRYLERWKETVNFGLIKSASEESYDEAVKFKWAMENQLGEVISFQDILHDKYRRHYFATWV